MIPQSAVLRALGVTHAIESIRGAARAVICGKGATAPSYASYGVFTLESEALRLGSALDVRVPEHQCAVGPRTAPLTIGHQRKGIFTVQCEFLSHDDRML